MPVKHVQIFSLLILRRVGLCFAEMKHQVKECRSTALSWTFLPALPPAAPSSSASWDPSLPSDSHLTPSDPL